MIFVTVGTQLPFDRMVRVVDDWAARTGFSEEVFAQIGPTQYRPKNMRWVAFLSADDCREHVGRASLVVSHAGMGSIITALELGKPIVVMPRRASLGEQRNDHQLATVKWLSSQGRVTAALSGDELTIRLNELRSVLAFDGIPTHASPNLLSTLRTFINDEQPEVVPRHGWNRLRTWAKRAVAADARGEDLVPTA